MAAVAQEGFKASDIEKLASMIGAYMSKQQPDEVDEEEDFDPYSYDSVKKQDDLYFHPDKFYGGVNFRTMILDPNIFTKPWFWPISHNYVRKLQYCLEQARLYIHMNELDKVDLLKKQCEDLRKQVLNLERDLAKAQGQSSMREQYLTTTIEAMGGNKRLNMIAQDVGMEPIKEDTSADQERNSTGKFVSSGGLTGTQKKMMVAAYSEAGCKIDDIARYLDISPQSVRAYVSSMKAHWKRRELKGREYLWFDENFNEEAYWLDEFSPELLAERIEDLAQVG